MQRAQVVVNEIKGFWKRRKALMILCTILVLGLSAGAAFYLPPQYKSSITILVDENETLNPMIRYNMAVAMASEDQLQAFNDIVYSRPSINKLIDTLDLAKGSELSRDKLIENVRDDIQTQLKASNSFSITFYSRDPRLAKQGAQLLSDQFISTKQQFENQRNGQTVEFFQEKLKELQKTVKDREQKLMDRIEQNVRATPARNKNLQSTLEDVSAKVNNMSANIQDTRNRLEIVRSVNSGEAKPGKLLQVGLSEVAGGQRILGAVNDYQDLSDKYTDAYPKVRQMREKVYKLAGQLEDDLQSKLFNQQAEKEFLESQREQVSKKIQQSTVAERQTNQSEMNLDVYKNLYDEMKVKLEQAKTTRDLGRSSKSQFKVIEPPVVPEEAAKPNRILLVGGGLFLGLFLGLIVAAVAELLDTTIRQPQDLKKFNKPVVAYISKG